MNPSLRAFGCCLAWLALAAPAAAACGLTRVAQMPLVQLGAHFAVMVGIDDVLRPMIVDTGAPFTVLRASFVDSARLTPDPSYENVRPTFGLGQTQSQADVHPNVMPARLALGDLVFHDRSTGVATMDFGGALPENDFVGLIGDDILGRYDVEFDFPGRMLTFYRADGCYETFVPWTGPYAAIPFDHKRGAIVIDVLFDGERTRTLLDTGNNGSFVLRRSMALWGVSDAGLSVTKARSTSPLNGGTSTPISMFMFQTMTIGDETVRAKPMAIVDLDVPLASANLGLDYLGSRRIWLSYPNGWIFIADKGGTTSLAYPVTPAPTAPAAPAQRSAAIEAAKPPQDDAPAP